MDSNTREFLRIWTSLPPEAQQRLLGAAKYEQNASTTPQQPLLPPEPTKPHKTK